MAAYSVAQARNNLAELIDRALRGEEVTVTRHGKPVVDMVPRRPEGRPIDPEWIKRRRFTPAKGPFDDPAHIVQQMREDDWR